MFQRQTGAITVAWTLRDAKPLKLPVFTTLPRRGKGDSAEARPWSLPVAATRQAQAAMFLAESAERVLLVIRGEGLAKSMSSYLSRGVDAKENIEILRDYAACFLAVRFFRFVSGPSEDSGVAVPHKEPPRKAAAREEIRSRESVHAVESFRLPLLGGGVRC